MNDLAYRLRYLLPVWLLTILLVTSVGTATIAGIFLLPKEITGDISYRTEALFQVVKWEARAFSHSEDGFVAVFTGESEYEPQRETGGIFLGVTKNGNLLIDTYEGLRVEAVLADLVVDNLQGIAAFLEGHKYQHVLMDIYEDGGEELHVVRLRDGTPINLLLIEEKLAHASPNPPTSIVDRMMATYWWHVFKGEVESYAVHNDNI